MSEMDDIEAKLMEALKRAYRIGYDDAVAKLQPALANLESMLAETRITEPARHMESFKAMAPKLIAAWNDFTSQEMYGEAIREPGRVAL